MKFSIIIATLNNQDTLEKNLKSIKDQDYKDFEIIVVDGGSKDKTIEILKIVMTFNGIIYQLWQTTNTNSKTTKKRPKTAWKHSSHLDYHAFLTNNRSIFLI